MERNIDKMQKKCVLECQSLIIDNIAETVSSSVNWPIKHAAIGLKTVQVTQPFEVHKPKIMSWYSVVIALKQFTSCLKAIMELV